MKQELKDYLEALNDEPSFVAYAPVGVRSTTVLGDTPLHYAAGRNDLEIACLLIEAGALIDARGETGYTPLHEAVSHGYWRIAHVLITRGASLQALNDDGQTPLDLLQILHELDALPPA